jgi:hypothetical protein
MSKYSAIVTCFTECVAQVEASSEREAKEKLGRGEFSNVVLHDGGLDMSERFIDVEIVPESFGRDDK